MSGVTAIILAGGKGTRMDILCYTRPKPALPFAGRFRVIDFSLSNCIHSQINDVALLTDYQRSYMASYLKHWNLVNAKHGSLHILEPKAGSYRGTADAVYQNLDYLTKHTTDRVLILAGDHIYKMDYRKMLAFHEQMKADVSVGVVSVPIEQTYRFGTVTLGTDSRITDFAEKSETPQSNLVSMGIYIFNKNILARYLIENAAETASLHDFGYSLLPILVKREKVFAYRFSGYWQDIGTIETYYEANMQLIQKKPSLSLDATWPIFTDDNNQVPINHFHGGSVVNSLISAGCVIKGRVANSILSPGVWVEEQAVVRNSVLMSNVSVGYHSTIESCILDESVSIGEICYIGFGDSHTGTGACTVLGKGVTVPPHIAIGRNCRVAPYSGPADFTTNVLPQDYRFVKEHQVPRGVLVGEANSL